MKNTSILVLLTITLMGLGLVSIYSASFYESLIKFKISTFFFKRQFIWDILAIILMFITAVIKPEKLRKLSGILILLAITFLIIPILFSKLAIAVKGAKRWIRIFGFTFQPSEFAKLAIIIFNAHFLSKEKTKLENFSDISGMIIVNSIILILVLLQPDFSTALVIFSVFFVSLWVAGFNKFKLISILILLAIFSTIIVTSTPYRMNRIKAWLDPWKDRYGIGYHIIQNQIAIGTGGLFGVGIANSINKVGILPEQHTDSIFAIFAEEFGFVGSVLLISIYFIIIALFANITFNSNDKFRFLLGASITFVFAVHIIINIGVCLGILPPTGIPLPFLSYGGSATIVFAIEFGIMLAITNTKIEQKKQKLQINTAPLYYSL